MIGAHIGGAVWSVRSAAAFQQSHASATDSVVVESPLPGGVAHFVRFLLNTVPPWLQLAGVVIALAVAAVVLWFIFARRRRIAHWLTTRARPVRIALIAAAAVFLLAAAGFGAATWNYTQHSNAFCTGCHVMNPAYERMAFGETEHSRLSCHDCHQQSMLASARQLYVWVAERPEEIGEHAKVPNRICESCHVTGDTATWQRIASTAGHRVHLESDSSALRDLQCVTCHGVEVHRFQPVNRTCGQSGCHEPEDTDIVLGKMAGQTVRHCTNCHEFTVAVPALATLDSARGTLVPGQSQCLGCHEMQQMLADFDPRREPHGGKCGACHNPHEQETPEAAANTCASAGCHGDWREEPFHSGTHRRVASQCLTCHLPHAAKVDASECRECHEAVRTRGRLRPPVPFDTGAALRRTQGPRGREPPGARPRFAGLHGGPAGLQAWALRIAVNRAYFYAYFYMYARYARGWHAYVTQAAPREPVRVGVNARAGPSRPAPAAADSFSHARHARLACLVCHETGAGHGRLTFERPRGCQICHHQAPARARCASCHRTAEYTAPQRVTVSVTVPGHRPKPRPVDFLHAVHDERPCLECHSTPVTLAPPPAKAACRDCHSEHHEAGRSCASCHASADPRSAHQTLEAAHQRCDGCHTTTTVAQLTPTRSFCTTCHTKRAEGHYDNRECTVCHFLAEPRAYRPHLLTPPRAR